MRMLGARQNQRPQRARATVVIEAGHRARGRAGGVCGQQREKKEKCSVWFHTRGFPFIKCKIIFRKRRLLIVLILAPRESRLAAATNFKQCFLLTHYRFHRSFSVVGELSKRKVKKELQAHRLASSPYSLQEGC